MFGFTMKLQILMKIGPRTRRLNRNDEIQQLFQGQPRTEK